VDRGEKEIEILKNNVGREKGRDVQRRRGQWKGNREGERC
jgi:hypothetical protein